MNTTEQLRAEIEAAAAALGVAPSTVGERAGQGGRFYARLCEGKRVWPETAETVRLRIASMLDPSGEGSLACTDHNSTQSVAAQTMENLTPEAK